MVTIIEIYSVKPGSDLAGRRCSHNVLREVDAQRPQQLQELGRLFADDVLLRDARGAQRLLDAVDAELLELLLGDPRLDVHLVERRDLEVGERELDL